MDENVKSATTKTADPIKRPKGIRLSYERRKGLYGYGFIGLWLVGTIVLFVWSIIQSVNYSFKYVTPGEGDLVGYYVGFQNYYDAFMTDPKYRQLLVDVLKDTALQVPLILIFSLFIAVILNQNFHGRTLARAVFFLPVIIVTGPVYGIITGDIATSGVSNAGQFSTMFETDLVGDLLNFIGIYGISPTVTEYVQTVTSETLNLVWNSGVQILIFLAALQNIPLSAKEAAQMEGATSWEYFWKITFPYVSPMILANLIYTIIDKFSDPTNGVMKRILVKQSEEWEYGLASAMVWSYFLIVMVVVALIFIIVNKFVYYEVD